ncbi:hypothetical protein N9W11_00460 [Psychrosphaera haliotis]|nr:hypothetical protein [Psychrosphaera haliotis]
MSPVYALDSDKLVVVTNIKAPVESLSKEELIDLFMGRYVAFPGGASAKPLDVSDGSGAKEVFYRQLLGLSLGRINSYWSRLRFTGKAQPPQQIKDFNDVKEAIKTDNEVITYIYQSQVNESMKVVYQFEY